jgi:uncharacterized protein (DUF2249 family)
VGAHTAPFDELLQIVEGDAKIIISGQPHRMLGGEMILMPAGRPQALKALQRFEMILTMIHSRVEQRTKRGQESGARGGVGPIARAAGARYDGVAPQFGDGKVGLAETKRNLDASQGANFIRLYLAAMKANEVIVDVSAVIPRERHPKVFNTWHSLAEGTAMLLVNDHDPVSLYYLFAAEYRGGFRWEYLERGPKTWRVRISKGQFADPGYAPRQRVAPVEQESAARAVEPLVLDVRPIVAQGGSPCTTIDDAVASLRPGQTFVLLVPFEPAPLFGKLGAKGLKGRSELQADGSYRIEFTPGEPVLSGAAAVGGCGCGGL